MQQNKKVLKVLFKILLFLIIIIVGLFIIKNLSQTETKIERNITIKGVSKYDIYNENDIIIQKEKTDYNGVKVEIPQIVGLINKENETKINDSIKNTIIKFLDNCNLKITKASFDSENCANFSNTISIKYYCEDENNIKHILGINLELVNGNNIILSDLFLTENDYLLFKYKDFNNFYYTPKTIFFVSGDNEIISQNILEIGDTISIYSKYLTIDSIYEDSQIGSKGLYACTENYYDYSYGKLLEDNLYIQFGINGDDLNGKLFNLKNKLIQDVDEDIKAVREEANANKDKIYIVQINNRINQIIDGNKIKSDEVNVKKDIYIVKCSMDKYANIFEDELIKMYNSYPYINDMFYKYSDIEKSKSNDQYRVNINTLEVIKGL